MTTTQTNPDNLYNLWKDVVAKVSKKVSREFPEVEAEDLYQDLFLWIVERMPDRERDDFAFRTLELVARDKCWEYRIQYLAVTGQYVYRPSDVRKLVSEYLFKEEYIKDNIVIDEQPLKNGNRGSVPLDFEDRIAVHADALKAFQKLPDNYRDIIERVYRDGEKLTTSALEMRLSRAIDRMTSYLNAFRGDVWTRN